IGVLGIKAGDTRVVGGDALDGIRTSSTRRIGVQAVFEDLLVRLFSPERDVARGVRAVFPEEGVGGRLGRALKVVEHRQVRRRLRRVIRRWWAGTQLTTRGECPRLPGAGQRQNRI